MDIDTSPLKRCSSAPVIPNATARTTSASPCTPSAPSPSALRNGDPTTTACAGVNLCDTPPAPNIFSRTRRYSSGSFSPLAGASPAAVPGSSNPNLQQHPLGSPSPAAGPRLTPRVSQLRKEECAESLNTREVSHERGLHNQIQISQSWEDLTIVTESWSCRDDMSTNSLPNCSSPSPTSSRHQQPAAQPQPSYGAIRYPFGMSPSPTRKTFATRRSMSPNHVRPSQLCPVKRKFDMDDSCGGGSPPPHKKMFLDVIARGSSPIHSLPMCSSPDSGTYEGRTTPKLFISKLCSSNSRSSFSSASASPTSQLEGMGEAGGVQVDKGLAASVNSATTEVEGDDAKDEPENGDQSMLDVSALQEHVACGGEERGLRLIKEKMDAGEVDDGIGEEVATEKASNGDAKGESEPVSVT